MEAITSTNSQAQAMAKKAWKIITLLFSSVRKAITNTNLHLLKHGSKLAGKAIEALFITLTHHHNHHHHHHVYHKDVVRGFKEYEFSCSSSPALFHLIPLTKKGRLRRRRNDAFVAAAVQRVFDMLNTDAPAEGAGSTVATPMLLPGFGKSPAVPVRQLRVTDSPFPVGMNEEEAVQVSKAAEEFITNFYRNLKREKSSTAFESPCRNRH